MSMPKAPKTDPVFLKYWKTLFPKVVEKGNYHSSHLSQLEILCDLYVDYHALTAFVRENGYSFITTGRYGETSREYVEVKTRAKVISDIRAYTRLLGLTLDKQLLPEDNDSEWE